MLSNKRIEGQDYSTDDVADLKHRLEIAINALKFIAECLYKEEPLKAYGLAVNELARIESEHSKSCESTELDQAKNIYRCDCELILSGE